MTEPPWLARFLRFLGVVPSDQADVVRLADSQCWRIEPTRDAALFYRAVSQLRVDDAVVYLEGTTEKQVPQFLLQHVAPNPTPMALGTILPASDRYHMPATAANLSALADLVDSYGIALPSIHTHLYANGRVVLEWFDAFTDAPLYVTSSLSEDRIRAFAQALNSKYRWADHAA